MGDRNTDPVNLCVHNKAEIHTSLEKKKKKIRENGAISAQKKQKSKIELKKVNR